MSDGQAEIITGTNECTLEKQLSLQPLIISSLVVKKKDLIEALRVYLPAISDIEVFGDGERFAISLGSGVTTGED